MDPSKYGPFANVVAVAGALVVTFSVLLLKMLGGVKRWAWLAVDLPPFLLTLGARIVAVALMAVTYVVIDTSNYSWFGAAAVISAVLGFWALQRFDALRRRHVAAVPLVGPDGQQLHDRSGALLFSNVIMGSEVDLRPDAATAFIQARQRRGVSLREFMSGYTPPNDPEALWDRGLLAEIGSRLATTLMLVLLCAVMTLFLAAFVIEVGGRRL
jgi:hypothetical protein